MPKQKSYCIFCGKERDGLVVEDDYVLKAWRWFKRNVTKNEQGNRLVVCRDDYMKYKKARAKYVRRQVLYVALGVIFLVLAVASAQTIVALVVGLVLLLFLYLLSLLSYTPKVHVPAGAVEEPKKKAPARGKR